MKTILVALSSFILIALGITLPRADDRIQLTFDTSEAEAVLAIVARHQAGQAIPVSDWERLFATKPYRRLRQREDEMNRSFTDDSFQEFVLSDDVMKLADKLRQTLTEWKTRDLDASARRVLAYLPPEARIHAAVYPMIKPRPNTFVYDVRRDPAVFFYLDPAMSAAEFENTAAHELHHIGFASIGQRSDSIKASLPDTVRKAVLWMGAFGEGFAMLAAAGGPDVHPHSTSKPEDRARWDSTVANFNQDLRSLEEFFMDILDGRLTSDDEIRRRAISFFGVQGPWYTVGYEMALLVERTHGREVLIDCMFDPRQLLVRYNASAAEMNNAGSAQKALWSKDLLQKIGAGG